MALCQAGRGAARLLLQLPQPAAGPLGPSILGAAAGGPGLGAGGLPLLGLSALALQAASLHLPSAAGLRRRRRGLLPPPPFAAAPWGVAGLRGLQAPSDAKGDAAKGVPDAQVCDDAIKEYQEVRTSRRPPSTYRTAAQRTKDVLSALVNAVIWTVRFVASLPGKIWALRLKSREQWAADWASLKKTVKHEAQHYWLGTKLLATDARIASGLALKTMRGTPLTRRERRQLTRTTADLFRLVPMIIILVVPFMELALPLLLKLFPNMLPSTFEDKMKKEEDVKRRLVAKLEVARFLQDTMAEMAKDIKSKRTGEMSASAEELFQFINKVRAGSPVDSSELVKFARLFNDELTLDRLDRVQLVSMCQLLSIPPFGTDGFLRNRLRSHLEKIKQDDRLIQAEGLDNLTADELRSACRARGMKAVFGDGCVPYMRTQMKGWLDLSQRGLPSSLLLLSRALVLTTAPTSRPAAAPEAQLEGVRDTLLTLPEEVIQDVGLEVGAGEDGPADLQKRLDLIQKEQAMIKQEAAAAKELEAKQKAAAAAAAAAAPTTAAAEGAAAAAAAAVAATPAAAGEAGRGELKDGAAAAEKAAAAAEAERRRDEAAQHAAAVAAASAVIREAAAGAVKDAMAQEAKESLAAEGVSEEERAARIAAEKEARMKDIISALAVLASSSGVVTERAAFMKVVKREVDRLQDTLGPQTTAQLVFTSGGLRAVRPEDAPAPAEVPELRAPLALEERVGGILMRIEHELDDAEKAIGERLHVIDLDGDGMISKAELEEALRFLKANLDDEDLLLLLDRLKLKAEPGADQPLISVEDLVKLAEGDDGGSAAAAAGGASAPSGAAAPSTSAAAAAAPAEDVVKIHTR